jgi:acyl transferase domain-containing protein/acyl carrier protein
MRAEPRQGDIAVIGMACRFPGAPDVPAFWQLLSRGGHAIGAAMQPRWMPGEMPSPARAGFIDNHDGYDPGFFGIPLAEARAMDPQQLLALQVGWHALEDARIDPARLAGQEVGVFMGATSNDFEQLVMRQRDAIGAFSATGTNASIVSARIAYALDLRGPCMTLNTACSSSLVAVHEACLHLRAGQCGLALAGGVNLLLAAETTLALTRAGMMAADGACKTFDDAADGYVRGEGCGMVVLKPLAQALRDGDRIHAVIQGCAMNQDGLTNGLTAPNRHSQEALIRRALADAGLQPQDVGYVEAHGTGTRLGDPIEVNALRNVYGPDLGAGPCYVGAVKAQIGHLEPAAGIAGLIKCILQIKHRSIVGQSRLKTPNRLIRLDGSRLRISTDNVAWDPHIPCCAGVSAFGYGGTNCHVLLAPPPPVPCPELAPALQDGPALVLPLAARSPAALDRLREAHRQVLAGGQDAGPWCASAALGAQRHGMRRAFVGSDPARLLQALEKPLAPIAAPVRTGAPGPAFLFPGQGSQQAGMGQALNAHFAVFREVLDAAQPRLREALGMDGADLLWGRGAQRLDRTDHTQPALYLLQVGLARIWQSLGVFPQAVAGHSIGEYAAAHVAGVFDFDQGLRMVLARGHLMQHHAPPGHMVAVRATAQQVQELLARMHGQAQLAAINSASDLVVAVRPQALAGLRQALDHRQLRHLTLKGDRAFHCEWMQEAALRFERLLAGETFQAPRVAMADNLGSVATPHRTLDAAYWVRQMVSPVCFGQAMAQPPLARSDVLVEIGVGGTLLSLASRAQTGPRTLVPSIQPGEKGMLGLTKACAVLFEAGVDIEWKSLYPQARPCDLPAYPFEVQPVFDDRRYRPAAVAESVPRLLARGWVAVQAQAPSRQGETLLCFGPDRPLMRAMPQDMAVHCGDGLAALDAALAHAGMAHVLVFAQALAPRPVDARSAADLGLAGLQWWSRLREGPMRVRSLTLVMEERGDGSDRWFGPLMGALQSAVLESPGLHLKLVHVRDDAVDAQALCALARGGRAGEFQLHGAVWQEAVLQAHALPPASMAAVRADRCHVITGGSGSLGRQVLQALVARGARRIVVAGRNASSAGHRVPPGVHLTAVDCDVSVRADVQRLLHEATREGWRLGGIFHAAGVASELAAAQWTAASWMPALAAKVAGTHWLSELAEPLGPDFMVCFSSISSLWGARGLSAYAAGNRFLDEWCRDAGAGSRRLAINWGPWQGSAMVDDQALQAMGGLGIGALSPDAAIAALFALLDGGARGQWAWCAADWQRLATLHQQAGPSGLFSALVADTPAGQVQAAAAPRRPATDGWRQQIRGVLADLLGQPVGDIPADEPLHALGIDSLRAIEFARAVELAVGRAVPATLVFEHPSLGDIEAHLARLLGEAVAGEQAAEPGDAGAARQEGEGRDIAIIGMGCLLPGGSDSPERFWQLLQDRIDPVAGLGERGNALRFVAASGPGRGFGAALVDGMECFDARLFGVPPAEARAMDPQQRMGLELAWRCFEQAGYRRRDLKGRAIGTYLGAAANEYRGLAGAADADGSYEASGNALSAIAGRIAFHFGLHGAAVALDTACSSSLVALHQAVAALRAGECEMALAGGVNALLSDKTFAALERARMLSPSWRCASFDGQADGYVRGEGGALFLLKPLASARRDGDRVLAVIKGSAVNQDGRSASLTAPHGPAQVDVMRRALADAGLQAAQIDWIEAHGTGTPLGDPIELRSIDQVYGDPGRDLVVGAVKSNIGHLEAASGAVGLLKAVLALQHGQIPPNLHYSQPNPHTGPLACARLRIPTRSLDWPAAPAGGRPRRAAISSFGFSGTNAHLLLEEAPDLREPAAVPFTGPWLLPISAHSQKSFEALLAGWRALEGTDALAQACLSACWHCEPLRFRQVLTAASIEGLRAQLHTHVAAVEVTRTDPRPVARLALKTPPALVRALGALGVEVQLDAAVAALPAQDDGLAIAAALFCEGADIDWRGWHGLASGPRPARRWYPMDKTAFWHASPPAGPAGGTGDFVSLMQAQMRTLHGQLATMETQLPWTR